MSEKASIPDAWEAPFTDHDGLQLGLVDIGNNHFVRVARGTDPKELAA